MDGQTTTQAGTTSCAECGEFVATWEDSWKCERCGNWFCETCGHASACFDGECDGSTPSATTPAEAGAPAPERAAGQVTSRAFGKCKQKGCKGRKVLEVLGPGRYTAFDMLRKHDCPQCGSFLEVSIVRVTASPQTPCTASCTSAMTPGCKCSCGGVHHGEDVAEHDRWSGS